MKLFNHLLLLILTLFLFSCDPESVEPDTDSEDTSSKEFSESPYIFTADGSYSIDSYGTGGPTTVPGGPELPEGEAGLVTAGEWNDLEHWDFWNALKTKDVEGLNSEIFQFNTDMRYAVKVTNSSSQPLIDAKVELKVGGKTVWMAKTDNTGTAELWTTQAAGQDFVNYTPQIWLNGTLAINNAKTYEEGINNIIRNSFVAQPTSVDISFIVDATGSMSDEIAFLQKDLNDVLNRANSSIQGNINTSSVFYRDEGDEYVVKSSEFGNISSTTNFINQQSAGGGGDFPEAVHSALEEAILNLNWSKSARTRIAFLLLDAPPHSDQAVSASLLKSIKKAAEKGVKIIPIVASGINKQTEFVMRHFAMATNGTYVFITNHSGIGNDHIEATVGDYEVEYLNDLMVRLIEQYSI